MHTIHCMNALYELSINTCVEYFKCMHWTASVVYTRASPQHIGMDAVAKARGRGLWIWDHMYIYT